MLSWKDEEQFAVGDATFRILPGEGWFLPGEGWLGADADETGEADVLVPKPRHLVELYARLIEGLRPEYVFELGFYRGGSTALIAELARPRRLVAIDRRPSVSGAGVEAYASRRGLDGVVRIHGDVDQADRDTLAEIVEREFEGNALDFVVDDCSHQYLETRASFNELFPRLRPGGLFVIEDWPWAHAHLDVEPLEGLFPDQVPLTRLVFELVLALPSVPGLIADLTIDPGAVVVTRGDATADPNGFDIAACSNRRGRALLAPT
jgi:predicted O-methyltransferase YrrM